MTQTIKTILCIATLLAWWGAERSSAQTRTDTLMMQFEQAPQKERLRIANQIFLELYNDELTDSLIKMPPQRRLTQ